MLSLPNNEFQHRFPRRVSFDLSHNTVYLLPTLEQCRDAAKQRSREEWQRKTLNEDMLNEDIISEIQEDCSAGSRDSDDENESAHSQPVPTKSCLKKPPVVVAVASCVSGSAKKKHHNKKNQKKRKRNQQHAATSQNVIPVH